MDNTKWIEFYKEHPQDLLNFLNSVDELVKENADAALRMSAQLSKLEDAVSAYKFALQLKAKEIIDMVADIASGEVTITCLKCEGNGEYDTISNNDPDSAVTHKCDCEDGTITYKCEVTK